MKRSIYALLLWGLGLPACAAYQPPPLSVNHPAHIDAARAPRPLPSLTLAYASADIPSMRPALAADSPNQQPSGQMVSAEGKVVAVLPNAAQIVLEHGEIKGFMDAMTMGYRVEPPSLADGLKFGDKVRFTIDVAKKAIVKIDRIN